MKKDLKKIITLVSELDEIDGRKKFQKIVYILKQLGINFNEKYKFHYYGPYSPKLQLEIDSLVNGEILKEEKEGNAYNYKVLLEDNEYIISDFFSDEVKKLIAELKEYRSYILELVATFFYLKEKGYKKEEVIKKKTSILKSNLEEFIDEAYDIFDNIQNKNLC